MVPHRFRVPSASQLKNHSCNASRTHNGPDACATNRLNQLANDLRNTLVGTPVIVTQQEGGSILLTSSADYMFPSGGWQIPNDSPILNRIAPILAGLQNTQIVVSGFTDNTPVGPQLQRLGIADNLDLSSKRASSVVNYLASHGVNPSLLSAQVYGDAIQSSQMILLRDAQEIGGWI